MATCCPWISTSSSSGAAHVGDRRDEAEELLHRARDQAGVLDQDASLIGVVDHCLARAGDQAPGRLVARDEENLRRRQLLVDPEALTVVLGLGQLREQVVAAGSRPGPATAR